MHHSCSLPHNKHNMRQTNTTINSWYNNCLCAVWHVYLYSLTLHRWWLSSSDSYKRQLRSWSPEQQFTLQWLYRRPRSSVCLLLHHQYFTCKTKKNVNHRWIIKYPWTSYRVVQDFLHHCSSHLCPLSSFLSSLLNFTVPTVRCFQTLKSSRLHHIEVIGHI